MEKFFAFVNPERASLFARFSLSLMLIWFGAMNFTTVGEGTVTGWFSRTPGLSGMGEAFNWAGLLGALQLLAGLALALGRGKVAWAGATAAMTLSGLALLLLLFANVWIETLGGFPAIGAGQGIIKYVSILGVATFLGAHHLGRKSAHCEKMRKLSLQLMLFGIILVLAWIGGMKFTALEARGIEPLLMTSPFFSWLPELFGRQGASNFIGVVEIGTAILLLGWFFNRSLFLAGALLCVVTFLGTLSFLITLPGWQESLGGFPALSPSGHFLLKDLVMLGATFLLVAHNKS